jgi:hypothetical protein
MALACFFRGRLPAGLWIEAGFYQQRAIPMAPKPRENVTLRTHPANLAGFRLESPKKAANAKRNAL